MATYHVTAPDGTQYQVEGPDGATQEQVLAQVKSHHAQQMPSQAPDPGMRAEAPDPESTQTWGQAGSEGVFDLMHNVAKFNPSMQQSALQAMDFSMPFPGHDMAGVPGLPGLHPLRQKVDRAMAREDQVYQSAPASGTANLGGFIGNAIPWVVGGPEKLLTLAGDKAMAMLPAALARSPLANKAAASIAHGTIIGALNPVEEGADYGPQKAANIVTGAVAAPLLAGTMHGVGTAAGATRYLTGSGRDKIATARLGKMLDNAGADAQQLAGYKSPVPGYRPSLAESNPSPQMVQIQRMLQNDPHAGPVLRQTADSNNVALRDAVQGIAGDEHAVQWDKLHRSVTTQPFIDTFLQSFHPAQRFGNALKGVQQFLGNSPRLSSDDFGQMKEAGKIIQSVKSGAMQEDDGVAALNELGPSSKSAQNVLTNARKEIDRGLVNPQGIKDAIQTQLNSGIGQNNNVRGALQKLYALIEGHQNTRGLVGAGILDGIRQNAKTFLQGHPITGAVAPQEWAGVQPIAVRIQDTLNRAVPGYRDYLAAYAKGSQPINDRQAASGLVDAIDSGGRDSSGNQAVNLNPVKQLLARDNRATYPMSDSARGQIEAVMEALQQRTVPSNSTGATGSQTAANLFSSLKGSSGTKAAGSLGSIAITNVLGHALGLPPEVTETIASTIGLGAWKALSKADQDVMVRIATKSSNPQEAAKAITAYRASLGKPQSSNNTLRLLAPYTP